MLRGTEHIIVQINRDSIPKSTLGGKLIGGVLIKAIAANFKSVCLENNYLRITKSAELLLLLECGNKLCLDC